MIHLPRPATMIWASMLLLAAGACNAITGAGDLEIEEPGAADDGGDDDDDDDDDDDGAGGASTTGGNGPSTSTGTGGAATTAASTGTSDPSTSVTTSASGGPSCGDGTCDGGETCESCASDCGACSECGGASDATTSLDAEEQAFVGLINDYRAQNGLGPLTPCTSLNRAAQGHSEDLRDQDYFDHTGLDGSSPWSRSCDACYELGCGPATAMGENIAAGVSDAGGTFEQWRTSPGHDENMRGQDFTVMGIGRATGGGTYGVYWTNVFGGASETSCN